MKDPNDNGTKSSNKEEPIERSVVAQWPKDTPGSNQAPDDRSVKEDSIAWACPGAVFWEEVGLAYILDRPQQPPCDSKVDRSCYDGSNKLSREESAGWM